MNDLTIIYLTANQIPEMFAFYVRDRLLEASGDLPIIWVSKKPMDFENNIVSPHKRSHIGIYKDALLGVKQAQTEYIAIAEDDVLYSPDHFKYRPADGHFSYNLAYWGIYTWSNPPLFSYKGRRNHSSLICERDLYIAALEERFAKYPDEDKIDNGIWSEPGKYEGHLGVTERQTEVFYTGIPNIIFSHENELSFSGLGKRKRIGELRAYEIPYWGKASEVVKLYE